MNDVSMTNAIVEKSSHSSTMPAITINPDETQHKLASEQIVVLNDISVGINNLSKQLNDSLGKGEKFDEMNNYLKQQLKKDTTINIDAKKLVALQQPQQAASNSRLGGINVSKERHS
jgi:hypothetical protein